MSAPALTAGQVLDLADAHRSSDPVALGRLLLAVARPEWPEPALDAAPLGARDACVVELRRATFGERFAGRAVCPACGIRLALTLTADDVLAGSASGDQADGREPFAARVGGFDLVLRQPDGAALAAAAATGDVGLARAALVEACVVGAAGPEGEPVPASALPDDVVAGAGEALVERDPLAEVRLELACAACSHAWTCVFDVVHFVAAEIENVAEHLVEDVHVLAGAYGWTEDEIFELPSWRRRRYVERAAHA